MALAQPVAPMTAVAHARMALKQLQSENQKMWSVVGALQVMHELHLSQQSDLLQERQNINERLLELSLKAPRTSPHNPEKNRAAMEIALACVLPPAPPTFQELLGILPSASAATAHEIYQQNEKIDDVWADNDQCWFFAESSSIQQSITQSLFNADENGDIQHHSLLAQQSQRTCLADTVGPGNQILMRLQV